MQQTTRPDPLVAADIDLRKFQQMRVSVIEMTQGNCAWNPIAFAARWKLFAAAWHQIPAGSLPGNDGALAHFAGVGHEFALVKDEVMSDWILCSDDRYYNPVLAEQVAAAHVEMVRYEHKKDDTKDRVAKHRRKLRAQEIAAMPETERKVTLEKEAKRHDSVEYSLLEEAVFAITGKPVKEQKADETEECNALSNDGGNALRNCYVHHIEVDVDVDIEVDSKSIGVHKDITSSPVGESAVSAKDESVTVQKKSRKKPKTSIPEDFSVSDRVRAWHKDKGFSCTPDQHLEGFKLYAMRSGKEYSDWDAAFMSAITDDWSKIRVASLFAKPAFNGGQSQKKVAINSAGSTSIDYSAGVQANGSF